MPSDQVHRDNKGLRIFGYDPAIDRDVSIDIIVDRIFGTDGHRSARFDIYTPNNYYFLERSFMDDPYHLTPDISFWIRDDAIQDLLPVSYEAPGSLTMQRMKRALTFQRPGTGIIAVRDDHPFPIYLADISGRDRLTGHFQVDHQEVDIAAGSGFVELSPDVRVMVRRVNPRSHRLPVVYLVDGDCTYFWAKTPRTLERA